jgi:hypothetical protein
VADEQLWQRQLWGDVDGSCPVRGADEDDFLLQDDVHV